ncbi:MAG: hypothetical protein AAGI37_03960 [Planctomycetota bacterium]
MTQTATIPVQETRRYQCEHAKPSDADAIRHLLNQEMPGKVSFAMTHGADHEAAVHIASKRVSEVVVRGHSKPLGSVVGYGYRAVRPIYANGMKVDAGYLGGLRCETALRAAFRVLGTAFDTLAADREPGELPYDLTSIMSDNTVVRRGLEKGLPGLPAYVPIGEMVTLTIRSARHGRMERGIRRADGQGVSAIQAQLESSSPQYHGRQAWDVTQCANAEPTGKTPVLDDFLVLENEHGPQGCIALWDQRSLKQIVVADLLPMLRRLRQAINIAAFTTGRPPLPRPGAQLNMAYTSHAAFDLDDGKTASSLIAGVCAIAAQRGIELVSVGLPASAPVVRHLKRRFKPWTSGSVIYAVSHHPQSIDLDSRPVWMEIATL